MSAPPATTHRIVTAESRRLDGVADASAQLVVTSPPYPMIEMWDVAFSEQSPPARDALAAGNGPSAFEAMHAVLDATWRECARALAPGGFLVVNVGDAVRRIGGSFALYPNHARILTACLALGFTPLPGVVWRKTTNAPNKFMGSGVLPAGAYVTLEHEHVLVMRKGPKREFSPADAARRRASAIFWEERNRWFSDVWEFKGEWQDLRDPEIARRSAAFPLELPYRAIAMYSIEGDLVLDPFNGTGTTTLAALMLARSSAGFDRDASMERVVRERVIGMSERWDARSAERLAAHARFVAEAREKGREIAHANATYGFPVVTSQEKELRIPCARAVTPVSGGFEAEHGTLRPPAETAVVPV